MVFRNWAEQPRSSKMATISRDHQTSRINLAIKENDIRLYLCLKSIYKNDKTQEQVMGIEKEAIICCLYYLPY